MNRLWVGFLAAAMLLPATALRAEDDPKKKSDVPAKKADETPKTPAEELKALTAEYQAAFQKWMTEARKASQEGKAVDMKSRPNPQDFAAKFMALAEKHADDAVAPEALLWVASNVRSGPEAEKAMDTLFEKYAKSEHIGTACEILARSMSNPQNSQKKLRGVMKTHADPKVQGQACYALASMYKRLLQIAPMMEDEERAKQFAQFYGKEYVEYVKGTDVKETTAEIEKLFETLASKYGDVKGRRGTFGELAERELFEIRNLAVGCEVPDIVAEDVDGTEFKLSDYRGKVVMLDFWGDW